MVCFLILLLGISLSFPKAVAEVNGRVITLEEFNEAFSAYWEEILHFSGRKPTFEDRREFLFEYVKSLILMDIADQMGIDVEEEEVREFLRRTGRREANPVIFNLARTELIVKEISSLLLESVGVTEGEIRAYYLLNRREFYRPDQVKLLRVIAEDKEKALQVYRILREGKVPEPSEGVIVGRERWFSIQALPEVVRRRIYPYRVGRVSRPIKLDTGYLILKVTGRRKAGILPLEEVKDLVRRKLLRIKRQEVFREWFREVLRRYEVKVYTENLR
ncbi:MAG: peptidyl-prolyl cis-trans isomerase [Aquificota bacterium]|nr:peptidyl-prolyl cis-trans isomerase [Aquificota bacterium]